MSCIASRHISSLFPLNTPQGSYVGIHSTGFRDFLLKPELLRAISDLGFEHPSEGKCEAAAAEGIQGQKLTPLFLRAHAPRSATRMHPAIDPRHGRRVPGQVWYG